MCKELHRHSIARIKYMRCGQTIATDDPVALCVCQSVSHTPEPYETDPGPVLDGDFRVSKNIVLDGGERGVRCGLRQITLVTCSRSASHCSVLHPIEFSSHPYFARRPEGDYISAHDSRCPSGNTPPCRTTRMPLAITDKRTDERHYLTGQEVILFLAPLRKKNHQPPGFPKGADRRKILTASFPVSVAAPRMRIRSISAAE